MIPPGLKIYQSRGRWYVYHRLTNTPILQSIEQRPTPDYLASPEFDRLYKQAVPTRDITKRPWRHGGRHGASRGGNRSPEFQTWLGMLARCNTPSCTGYANYGARGIEIEFTSFEHFLADIGPKPTRGHWIDRIDSAGNYAPGNVRWVTPKESAKNCRPRKTLSNTV